MYQALIVGGGFALGAVGRRVVGGLVGDLTGWAPPHLLACFWLGLCMGGAAAIGGAVWWGAIACGVGAWIGHVALGLWNSAGMGHYGDGNVLWRFWGIGRWISDVDGKQHSKPGFVLSWLGMTAYGLQVAGLGVLVVLCPVVHGHWLVPLLGGLAVAPAYALAWAVWRHLPIFRGVTGNPLQLAEWLAGGAIGVGLALMAV